MNLRTLILSIAFFSTIIPLCKCISYRVVEDSNQRRVSLNDLQIFHKLGVAVLFSKPIDLLIDYEGISELTKSGLDRLEESDWSQEYNLHWIDTWLDASSYDYSQDYRLSEKKNLIEIQVRTQHIANPKNFILYLMTLFIIPYSEDYKINISSAFYDNSGKRHNLNTGNSLSIRLTKSLLFAFSNKANIETKDSIQRLFQAQIIESYKEIESRNLAHSEFKSSMEPKEIPFRMKINYFACDSKYSISYGTANKDDIIFDTEKYVLCHTQVNFRTHTKNTLSLHTKDFQLYTKNQKIPSIQKITANYSAIDTDGKGVFNRRGVTRDLSRSFTLKPDASEFGSFLEIRFLVPKEEARSIDSIRWEDQEQSLHPSDVWIGWDEGE